MERKYEAVEWKEYNGYGAYIFKSPFGIMFNYNDICDLLDFKYQKRKRELDKIDELRKTKIWFIDKTGNRSEESFINVPAVSNLLTDYGVDICVMMERKYNIENLVYHVLNEFDEYDKNKEDEYRLGDKFVLDTLYCDSIIADKANSNLINLLRQNELFESALHHIDNIDYKEKHEKESEIKELIELCNGLEETNSKLQQLIEGLIEPENYKIDIKSIIKADAEAMNRRYDDERNYL